MYNYTLFLAICVVIYTNHKLVHNLSKTIAIMTQPSISYLGVILQIHVHLTHCIHLTEWKS